jgi:hypothetical protein
MFDQVRRTGTGSRRKCSHASSRPRNGKRQTGSRIAIVSPRRAYGTSRRWGDLFFFHHLFFVERLHSCVCVPFTPSFKRQNIHKFVFYSIRESVFGWEWDRVFLYFGQRALGSALCVMYLCSIIAFCFLLSFFSNKTDHVKWKWKRNMEIDNWKMLSGLVAREGC